MLALSYPIETLIKVGAAAAVVPVGALIFTYVFLFKMMSFMQSRLGPMEAGPHGVLQPIVEMLKFLQKEDIYPERADRLVFKAAPFVVLLRIPSVFAFVTVIETPGIAAPLVSVIVPVTVPLTVWA